MLSGRSHLALPFSSTTIFRRPSDSSSQLHSFLKNVVIESSCPINSSQILACSRAFWCVTMLYLSSYSKMKKLASLGCPSAPYRWGRRATSSAPMTFQRSWPVASGSLAYAFLYSNAVVILFKARPLLCSVVPLYPTLRRLRAKHSIPKP